MVGIMKEGEGGEIRGTIPSNNVFAVHYPGYPCSTSRAIQTLGGLSSIAKARIWHLNNSSYNYINNNGSNVNLELHFRPEDPYSHPVSAHLRPCNYLLLRISAVAVAVADSSSSFTADGNNACTSGFDEENNACASGSDQQGQIVPDEEKNACISGSYQQVRKMQEKNTCSSVSDQQQQKVRGHEKNECSLSSHQQEQRVTDEENDACISCSDHPERKLPDEEKNEFSSGSDQQERKVLDKEKKACTSGSDQRGQRVQLNAGIVARVREAYCFEGMTDYQHVVAVHAAAAVSSKKRSWSQMDRNPFDKAGPLGLDDEDVMILLPPRFAPKDLPENLVLRPPHHSSASKKKSDEPMQSHFEIFAEPGLALDFNVKEIPRTLNWKDWIQKGSQMWHWQMAVAELFEERPIWPKDSLVERLSAKNMAFNHQMLKRLLLAVAYYFMGGPFLRFWIKKGYDPRKDPDSRIYQRIDFRVPPSLRSFCDDNTAKNLKHSWQDLCKFKVFPYKCHTSLQLYELDDDYIQKEIRKPIKKTTCTYGTGWFSRHMHESFRHRVMVRFLTVYPDSDARKLLKTASDDFQKSKKACAFEEIGKLNQEGPKMDTGDGSNGDQNGVDGEEMDEMEADDNEEELDAFDDLELDGEDGEISLQESHLYSENNSRSYLQDFFDTVTGTMDDDDMVRDMSDGEYHPVMSDDNMFHHGSSDEEYQIYEQDDDDDD